MEKDNEIEILKEINQNTKMGMDSISKIKKKYIIFTFLKTCTLCSSKKRY